MPLSKEEFEEACHVICPHCRAEATLAFRKDTKEFVHVTNNKGQMTSTICWASGLRMSRFAEGAENNG